MKGKSGKRPAGDLGGAELTRRCPTCRGRVTRADESRGALPALWGPVADTGTRAAGAKGKIMGGALIIAFSENGDTKMIPVANAGRLAVFATIEAGRRAAGALGVAVPVTPARVRELCERHGLALPDLRETIGGRLQC